MKIELGEMETREAIIDYVRKKGFQLSDDPEFVDIGAIIRDRYGDPTEGAIPTIFIDVAQVKEQTNG